jgi:hypothetical protein
MCRHTEIFFEWALFDECIMYIFGVKLPFTHLNTGSNYQAHHTPEEAIG